MFIRIAKSAVQPEGRVEGDARSIRDTLRLFTDMSEIDRRCLKKFKVPLSQVESVIAVDHVEQRALRSYIPTGELWDIHRDALQRVYEQLPALAVYAAIVYDLCQIPFLRRYIIDVISIIAHLLSNLPYSVVVITCIIGFSEQTTLARHGGNRSTRSKGRMWTLFSDWETLVGRLTYKQEADLSIQIRPWLLDEPTARTATFYRYYIECAAQMANRYFTVRPLRSRPFLTLAEFIGRPELWATTGSGYTGLTKRTENKWQIYSSYEVPEVLNSVMYGEVPPLKPIAKRELTKVRAVISSPFQTYIVMAYIEYLLSDTLVGKDFTTTLMTKAQRVETERIFLNYSGGWRTPIDQSNFDWQPDGLQIGLWIHILCSMVVGAVPPEYARETRHIVERLLTTTSYPNLKVAMDGGSYPVLRGLPSGWKWTALLGALINATQIEALSRMANVRQDITYYVVQGDDVDLHSTTEESALRLIDAYQSESFEVNLKKFWVANDRDEFLRRVSTMGVSAGYPARMLYKLLFQLEPPGEATPWYVTAAKCSSSYRLLVQNKVCVCKHSTEVESKVYAKVLRHKPARTSELATQWSAFIGRVSSVEGLSACPAWIYQWAARDLSHATKVTWDVLKVLLYQPSYLGGYGFSYGLFEPPRTESDRSTTPNSLLKYHMVPRHDRYLQCLIPTGLQVQCPRDEDLREMISQSPYGKQYQRIFRYYRLNQGNVRMWSHRLGDDNVMTELMNRTALSGEVGSLSIYKLSDVLDVSAVRTSSSILSRAGSAYRQVVAAIPESVRLSYPDVVFTELQKVTGFSKCLLRKALSIIRDPIACPRDPRFAQEYPSNWGIISDAASNALLTVPWTRSVIARTSLTIRCWFSCCANAFTQLIHGSFVALA